MKLHILSDLSGECCHDPFVIDVSPTFLEKRRDGCSVFSFLPKESTTELIRCLAPGFTSPLRDAKKVYSLGDHADVDLFESESRHDEAVAVVRSLLEWMKASY